MEQPLISCIVPVFDGELYLREALDSILAQTYRPLETIVVDDGSTDGTADVVASYRDRLRYVRQTNAGPGVARNHGLSLAQGEFVAFLDADDMWHPEKLARQMARFATRPDLDLCITHARHFWISELKEEAERLRNHPVSRPLPGYFPQAVLARRTLFDQVGRFNPALRLCSDMDWFLHAAEEGVLIEVLPDVLVYRRWHKSNITRLSRETLLQITKSSLDRRRHQHGGVFRSYEFPGSDQPSLLPDIKEISMHAQTNIQFFEQLHRESYSSADLSLMRDAYELAVRLFTGLYRPSGKTFIAHAVGTASIFSSLRMSVNLIAAALVHAAYEHGDFGEGTKGITASKREQVRRAVGKEAEEYVAKYTALRWNSKTIPTVYNSVHSLEPIDRDVLLIRLANELDDLWDLGIFYCLKAELKRQHHIQFGPMLVEMAEKLGFPALAAELTRVLQETASAKIFSELRSRKPGVILIPPRSYCHRPGIALRQRLRRVRERCGQLVHRVSPLCSTVRIGTKH